MVKGGAQPTGRRVALRALLRKSGSRVIRVCCLVVIRKVTANALRRRACKVIVHVALTALETRVGTRKGKLGQGVVIELGAGPCCSVMTGTAIPRESSRRVIGIGGGCEITGVTSIAIRRRPEELAVCVTTLTIELRVSPGQGEVREPGVIEPGTCPAVHSMTQVACGRKIGGLMIQRPGRGVVIKMTCDAVCAQSLELTGGRVLVAILAVYGSVGADQRKAVLMFFHRPQCYLPSPNRMALLAVASELTPMDVCVAIGALSPDGRKHQLDVALPAFHRSVETTQGISSFTVVEIRGRTNRLPARRRMAVLAGDLEGAVRTPRRASLLLVIARGSVPSRRK